MGPPGYDGVKGQGGTEGPGLKGEKVRAYVSNNANYHLK